MVSKVVLFDIDNTILWTGGAGSRAMALAFRDLYGIEDGFRGVEFSGRTDTAIFRDALRAHGLLDGHFEEELERFKRAYVARLPHTLRTTPGGGVYPGIPELAQALIERGAVVGLETGNFRESGMLKLRHYGVDPFFRDGAFGDDAEDRAQLVRIAIERLRPSSGAEIYVIGDTPHDVSAARANGAFALGVATGKSSVDELRAAGAHAAVPDCSDVDAILCILGF
jgi:phosphoglycolate phosphatase